jgi:hypothetical protein
MVQLSFTFALQRGILSRQLADAHYSGNGYCVDMFDCQFNSASVYRHCFYPLDPWRMFKRRDGPRGDFDLTHWLMTVHKRSRVVLINLWITTRVLK